MSNPDPDKLRDLYFKDRITHRQYQRGLSVINNFAAINIAGIPGLFVNCIARWRTNRLLKKLGGKDA